MADDSDVTRGEAGKKGGRGMSYPVMALEDAIEKARAFHREERKSAAPVASAIKHFGYSETSSGGRQTVSTLLQFGLLEDEGRSENRQVRLTDRALTILLDEPSSPERFQMLRECATMPKLYGMILAKYPTDLPSDHSLGFYLQKEFDFNPKTLKAFIEDFRRTLAFANVLGAPKMPPKEPPKPNTTFDVSAGGSLSGSVNVGDLIQWESSGVLRLDGPRRVRAKIEDNGAWWIFVEDSETGIPMEEVVVVERRAVEVMAQKQPPTLPMTPASSPQPRVDIVTAWESEASRGKLGDGVSYRLLVTGEMGAKQIGKLIKLLEAQKLVLDDDEL